LSKELKLPKNPFKSKNDASSITRKDNLRSRGSQEEDSGVDAVLDSTISLPLINNSPDGQFMSTEYSSKQAQILNKILEERRGIPYPTATIIKNIRHEDCTSEFEYEREQRLQRETVQSELNIGAKVGSSVLDDSTLPQRKIYRASEIPSLNLKKIPLRRNLPYSVHEFEEEE
jgi:hypothetical protein